ncbi:endonuclease domain-containing protein [Demequina capsici]|uniref:DUF559 domain-containing protein n=1 Tax=Demequina capsici TaxID=3075620 RepID=A0AA96F6D4_9MICO|nr:DUF559 domain-containing protein [Demequina sp. OYTSA14]WNM24921.1 DUF559 domain-containing protein [Demequina sp. OYTSA14]
MSVLENLDIAALCTSPLEQVVLLDAALNRGLLDPGGLPFLRHGTEARRRWVVSSVDARAQSLLESIARVELREAGLTVIPQAEIAGVGAVDLLVEGHVVVETDGYEFHRRRDQFARDRDRDRQLALDGYATLRYASGDVLRDPGRIVEDVVAVLWRRGWFSPTVRTNLDRAARVSGPRWWSLPASRH